MPLSKDEQIHLDAAQGFLELGMFLDADAELDRIDPFCRHLPEVLEVRVRIYSALKKWELVQVVAKRLWDSDPDEPKWVAIWADSLKGRLKLLPRSFVVAAPLVRALSHHHRQWNRCLP